VDALTPAGKTPCPDCGADPLEECWPCEVHLRRLIAAWTEGLVSARTMAAVLEAYFMVSLVLAAEKAVMTGRAA
jgi:hypothetical protein